MYVCHSWRSPSLSPPHRTAPSFAHDARALLWVFQANYCIGDPILHIELRRWADVVLIAPCSANTLAKIATGVCDNLAVSPPFFTLPLRAQFPSVPSYHIQHHLSLLMSFPKNETNE